MYKLVPNIYAFVIYFYGEGDLKKTTERALEGRGGHYHFFFFLFFRIIIIIVIGL